MKVITIKTTEIYGLVQFKEFEQLFQKATGISIKTENYCFSSAESLIQPSYDF